MSLLKRRDADTSRAADIARMESVSPTLAAVERRRRQLLVITSVVLLDVSIAVAVALGGEEIQTILPASGPLRWGLLGMALAFMLYVFDQERSLRRLTRALVDERVLSASLSSRIQDLTTLSQVGRVVNSVLTMEEVLGVILSSAFELTGARTGSVMLREGDILRVAVSRGIGAAPRGSTAPLNTGVAGWVATNKEPLLITGRLAQGQLPGIVDRRRSDGSAVCAPLIAAEELLGVLSVDRPPDARPFTEPELRSVALFAEHAATAVANAYRFESERRTAERLADVAEKRSEFTATMVHELKKPLTAVIGYASVLKAHWERLDDARRTQVIDRIEAQGDRLVKMVDEVLRSASLEAGANLRVEEVDLSVMLEELRTTATGLATARDGVSRQVVVTGIDQPVIVQGDSDALRHVFLNLAENAVKYSPAGSPIEVVVQPAEDHVVVDVTDHGAGIAEDEMPHLFERFRQRKTTAHAGGVGLGLYIVRTLVHAHGGRIAVRSRLGGGTTFSVRLPRDARGVLRAVGDELDETA